MKRLFLVPLCLVVLLLLPAVAQARPSFGQALDRLFAQGYPQTVDRHIASLGTNPILGFRWAGTSADNASALYVAQKLRGAGLKNVHLERVPVDVFDFKWASVSVGTHAMIASSFAGIRPTPAKGLTAQVVYAHDGTAQDFDALAAKGVSVKGKLVLVDANFDGWWLNYPAAEATSRGAIGLVMTLGPNSGDWYACAPDALGSNDAEYTYSSAPMVYIARKDGTWLKKQLAAHRVKATMQLNETVRLASDGGYGYNVFGDVPGTVKDGTFVLFDAHHDAHFNSATDDTAGVAANLAIAKAMVMSGSKPQHTVRFMFVTGEEFGYTNSWWDWCIGAWYAITHTHANWAGEIRGFLNNDQTLGHGVLKLETTYDLAPGLRSKAAAAGDLLPKGYKVATPDVNPDFTWNDSWTFSAAGVPAVTFSASGKHEFGTYHTDYMRANLIDWAGIARHAKFMARVARRFQHGLLPYDFKSRADDLASTIVPADLKAAGADGTAVDDLQTAVTAFQTAAADFEARRATVPAADDAAVDASMLQIEKAIGGNLTALSAFDTTIYPHQQVLWDVQYLDAAIADLQKITPDTADALSQLSNVAVTYYGLMLSHDVYTADLTRRLATFERADWGAQGHLIDYLDVIPQYDAIQGGTWDATTISGLQAMAASDVTDLNARLDAMTSVLQTITPEIAALH